ncbi:Probable voltage-gated potassium channel subunit beta [Galdieria sulphuraria]|uniref:Potassium channel beta subunit isoform 1 n=1 Tax=Galdieria sulphuraria TaxID=130081 RepID=M2XQL9_GALSU|nr:potassium channel beta subunit isoform 1 [Galdieria sulphuraria]EME25908.1 potassium channel beta subunit isoform 1 [Galdieria sulphuraria]GJD10052.1 Probable voltage-gated potassium channel subunit beta [Galdieria sulphuraria]|eukprot:XP_005702428.1 potassium channel beta subunit isoform 1 [Galdieria sulphuraria]
MLYSNLGKSGILAYLLMKRAYELGCNFFDNAETYAAGAAEMIMGQAFQRGIQEGIWSREDLFFSTKIFFGGRGSRDTVNSKGLSRKHVVEGLRASLNRMNLKYVDIVFCHRPDPLTPIEETVRAMNHVINRGWAFYWGTSEWSAQEITEACRVADTCGLFRPLCEQPQYHIFHRHRLEIEYEPLYKEFGIGTATWSPLAWGILTGKYSGKNIPQGSRLSLSKYSSLRQRVFNERAWQLEITDSLKPIAEELGCTLAQLAIAWCAANPNVSTVITGATKLEQLEENFRAIQLVPKLSAEKMKLIDEVTGTKPDYNAEMKMARRIRGLER